MYTSELERLLDDLTFSSVWCAAEQDQENAPGELVFGHVLCLHMYVYVTPRAIRVARLYMCT